MDDPHHRLLELQRRLHRQRSVDRLDTANGAPPPATASSVLSQPRSRDIQERFDTLLQEHAQLPHHHMSHAPSHSPPSAPAAEISRRSRTSRAPGGSGGAIDTADDAPAVAAVAAIDMSPGTYAALNDAAAESACDAVAPAPLSTRTRSLALYRERKRQNQGQLFTKDESTPSDVTLVMSPPRVGAPSAAANVPPAAPRYADDEGDRISVSSSGVHSSSQASGGTDSYAKLRERNAQLKAQVASLRDENLALASVARRDRSELDGLREQLRGMDESRRASDEAHREEVLALRTRISELLQRDRAGGAISSASSPQRPVERANTDGGAAEDEAHDDEAAQQHVEMEAALRVALTSLAICEQETAERSWIESLETQQLLSAAARFFKQATNIAVRAVGQPVADAARADKQRLAETAAADIARLKDEFRREREELVCSGRAAVDVALQDARDEFDAELSRRAAEARAADKQHREAICSLRRTASRWAAATMAVCRQARHEGSVKHADVVMRLYFALWRERARHTLELRNAAEQHDAALRDAAATSEACQRHLDECIISEQRRNADLQAELNAAIESHTVALAKSQEEHEAVLNSLQAASEIALAAATAELRNRISDLEPRLAAAESRVEELTGGLVAALEAQQCARFEQLRLQTITHLAQEEARDAVSRSDRMRKQRDAVVAHIAQLAAQSRLTAPLAPFATTPNDRGADRVTLSVCDIWCAADAAVARRAVFYKWLILACSGRREKLQVLRDQGAALREEIQRWRSMELVVVDTPALHPAATQQRPHRQQQQLNATQRPIGTSANTSPTRVVSPARVAGFAVPTARPDQGIESLQRLILQLRGALADDKRIIGDLRAEVTRCRAIIAESNDAYAELLACSEVWYSELMRLQLKYPGEVGGGGAAPLGDEDEGDEGQAQMHGVRGARSNGGAAGGGMRSPSGSPGGGGGGHNDGAAAPAEAYDEERIERLERRLKSYINATSSSSSSRAVGLQHQQRPRSLSAIARGADVVDPRAPSQDSDL